MPRIVILIKDLVLRSKIKEAVDPSLYSFIADKAKLEAALSGVSTIVIDLNLVGGDIVEIVSTVRGSSAATAKIIAFGSHVNKELLEAGKLAGADVVIPRSKFFGNIKGWIS